MADKEVSTTQPEVRRPDELFVDDHEDAQPLVNRVFDDWKQQSGGTTSPERPSRATDTQVSFIDFSAEVPTPEGGQKPDNVERKEVKGGVEKPPELKGVSDFSISAGKFDQLDEDTKDALTAAGVERISVVSTREKGKAVLLELKEPKVVPMPADSGCRSFTFDKKFSMELGTDKDGNVTVSKIKGLKALLAGNPPQEAEISKVVIKAKGKDGKPEIELTATVNGAERIQTLSVNPAQLETANESMKQLGKLIEASATGAFGELPPDIEQDVPNAKVPKLEDAPEIAKARQEDKDFVKSAMILLGVVGGAVAVGHVGRKFLRRGRDGKLDMPKESFEGCASDAVEQTLKDPAKLSDATPKSETKGNSTIYPLDKKLELKFKDKNLEIDAVEVVNGEVYLRSAKDGTRYSAKGWVDLIKDSLTAKAGGTGPEAEAAKAMLEKFNKDAAGKVSALQELAKNYAEASKGLKEIPLGGSTPSTEGTGGPLARDTRRTGGRNAGSTGSAEVASGPVDIARNEAGGYRIDAGSTGGAGAERGKGEELKAEEVVKLRKDILEDPHTTAEEKVHALRTIEMAAKPGEAAGVVRRAMEEQRRRRGGVEGVEGKAVGVGLVVLTLASWYTYQQMKSVREATIPAATVN